MAGHAIPIKAFKVIGAGDAQPQIRRFLEDDAETFKEGTPVVVYTSGYLIESPTLSSALKIAGFSTEPASDLTTDGTPETLSYGNVPNQSSAKKIPVGAPLNLGDCGVLLACDTTIFVAKCVDSHTVAVTDLGLIYGLTKDTNGYWFIDTSITDASSGAICEITDLIDLGIAGGRVGFRITHAGQQFAL